MYCMAVTWRFAQFGAAVTAVTGVTACFGQRRISRAAVDEMPFE
jgi:hypothetical protein